MTQFSRRRFMQTSAAGIAGLSGLPLFAQETKKASDTIRVGLIGIAGRGESNWSELVATSTVDIVALCDVDESRTGTARKRFPKATFYTDYRKLIDAKGLDAVLISTPDHTHAGPTMSALKAGLHVYCEKPLTHTVGEARLIIETAKKSKLVTQMGTQIHAGNNYRRVVELIQSGAIGKVTEIHTWCGKSWGGNGKRPQGEAVPKGLEYDLWLGPAAERPYSREYIPANWRKFWDFGGGTLNDMACHHMDLPFWAMKLKHPTRIEVEASAPASAETAPLWMIVKYDFPGVKLTWYDGGKRPELFAMGKLPKWGDGSLFIGDKGMMLADYGSYKLLPEDKFKGFEAPKQTIPNSIGHYKEWVEAIKTGGTTTCNFEYSGALTETVLLGTVAHRTGKVIEWDAENLKAKGVPEADKLIHKTYRKGWELA